MVPIPTLVLLLSKFSKPASILRALVLLLAKSKVEALASDKVAALMVSESPLASPMVVLPVVRNVPLTSRVKAGAVVAIPILEFELSIVKRPEAILKFAVGGMVIVVALIVKESPALSPIVKSPLIRDVPFTSKV